MSVIHSSKCPFLRTGQTVQKFTPFEFQSLSSRWGECGSRWTIPSAIAGVYLVFGLLWIWLSDAALFWGHILGEWAFLTAAMKGTLFVLLSGGLVFWIARWQVDALTEANDLFEAVFEGTTDAVFVKDLEGRYLYFNERAAVYVGRDVGDVLGQDDRLFFDEAALERVRDVDRRVALTGETITSEENLVIGGVTRTYHATKGPYRDRRGNVVGVIGIARDISGRKAREDALRESEEKFRTLVESLPDGVLIVSDEKVSYCNAAGLSLFGCERPDDLAGLLPGDIRVRKNASVERQCAYSEERGRIDRAEYQLRRQDGRRVPVRISSLDLRVSGGTQQLLVLQDESERKRVERQLRDQELLLREAAELAHVGGWGFDPVTLETDWTPEVARMYDLGTDSNAPGLSDALTYYKGEDRIRLERALEAAIEKGTPHDLELELTTARGTKRWVRTICRPEVENGKVLRVRGSLQDITDRKQLEGQFRQAQKMEAIGRLAGGVAHDFNNLLTVINGYAEMLIEDQETPARAREHLGAILEAGERAAGLTSQLLAFSRRAIIRPRVLDLNDVVRNSERLLRRLIREDIRLEIDLDMEACQILADAGQLDQVIVNLAVNARDAMPEGGELRIQTRLVRNENSAGGNSCGMVELCVEDTGSGISEEVKGQMFEPFFTTKNTGEGTGLGLAVVHGIVMQFGGEIGIESTEGKGTKFRIQFPERVDDQDISEKCAPRVAQGGNECILLVEDEALLRALCRTAMESQGYRVVEFANGTEAWEYLQKESEKVDLLVTDVVMPGMGGRELVERVRRSYPGIRALFLSGYTDDANLRGGLGEFKDVLLAKPFSPIQLGAKLREVLDGVRFQPSEAG